MPDREMLSDHSDPHEWCGFGPDHDGPCPGMALCPVCNGSGEGDYVPGANVAPECDTCGGTTQIDADDARRYRENSRASDDSEAPEFAESLREPPHDARPQTEGDRMSVIEHWTLRGAPSRASDPGRPMCVAGPLLGADEEVVVVRASNYEGAVELAYAQGFWDGAQALRDADVMLPVDWKDDAHRAAGGQSE